MWGGVVKTQNIFFEFEATLLSGIMPVDLIADAMADEVLITAAVIEKPLEEMFLHERDERGGVCVEKR